MSAILGLEKSGSLLSSSQIITSPFNSQSGAPVSARTCKHLKSLLGDAYEAARLKLKNPDGPPPKDTKKKPPSKKPASKAKPPSKAKSKRKKDDEDGEDEEDEDKPAKKRVKKADDDEEEDEETSTSGGGTVAVLLANKWDLEKGPDPTGWWISEKLDGVRYIRSRPEPELGLTTKIDATTTVNNFSADWATLSPLPSGSSTVRLPYCSVSIH